MPTLRVGGVTLPDGRLDDEAMYRLIDLRIRAPLVSRLRKGLGAPRPFLFDEAGSSRRAVHVDQREPATDRDRRAGDKDACRHVPMESWRVIGKSRCRSVSEGHWRHSGISLGGLIDV